MKILTKYDILIMLTVFITAVFSYAFIGIAASGNSPDTVEIMVDGELYASYKLNEVYNPQIIQINTEFGRNTLKITRDGAEMTDSDCKDRLDVKCGKITKSGQIIICIPNRVSVKLKGNSIEEVDKVTY